MIKVLNGNFLLQGNLQRRMVISLQKIGGLSELVMVVNHQTQRRCREYGRRYGD